MRTMIVLAAMAIASVCHSQERIVGAFGVELGQYFDPDDSTNDCFGVPTVYGREIQTCYFEPENEVPFLPGYLVRLTPRTHSVYSIEASGGNPSSEICDAQVTALAEALDKYGDLGLTESGLSFKIEQADRQILFNCTFLAYRDLNAYGPDGDIQREFAEIQQALNESTSDELDLSGL